MVRTWFGDVCSCILDTLFCLALSVAMPCTPFSGLLEVSKIFVRGVISLYTLINGMFQFWTSYVPMPSRISNLLGIRSGFVIVLWATSKKTKEVKKNKNFYQTILLAELRDPLPFRDFESRLDCHFFLTNLFAIFFIREIFDRGSKTGFLVFLLFWGPLPNFQQIWHVMVNSDQFVIKSLKTCLN